MLETLMILLIISTILVVTIIPFPKLADDMEKKMFFYQLQTDIQMSQTYAITKQKRVIFAFYNDHSYKVSERESRKMILHREFPPDVEFKGGLSTIMFLPNGNTDTFGASILKYKNTVINLIFHIGKGRFYVKEE